jgi:hypothetical protein
VDSWVFTFGGLIPTLSLVLLWFKLFQLQPLRAPSRWPWILSTCPCHFLNTSFPLGTQNAPGSSCIFPIPVLECSLCPPIYVSFIGVSHLEMKLWVPGVLIVSGASLLLGPQWTQLGTLCMYTKLHTYIRCLYIYFSLCACEKLLKFMLQVSL